MGSNPCVREIEWFDQERGDDWTMHIKRMDQYLVANGITESEKKVTVLLTVTSTKAYGLLHTVLTPTKTS